MLLNALAFLPAADLDTLELVSRNLSHTVSSNTQLLAGRRLDLVYMETDVVRVLPFKHVYFGTSVSLEDEPERLMAILRDPRLVAIDNFSVIYHQPSIKNMLLMQLMVSPRVLPLKRGHIRTVQDSPRALKFFVDSK